MTTQHDWVVIAMASSRSHRCPGLCGVRNVPHCYLACPKCWVRLPEPFRLAYNRASRAKDLEAKTVAIRAAAAWYSEQAQAEQASER
jgi:hypothetical protein